MDHPLENLGPERFQQLCQALLVREYPGVTCFPVAQPDGGRDAIQRFFETPADNFAVFQVKFARNNPSDKETREWVLDAALGEHEKILKLKERGASRYFFITNTSGTSHLDVGSIDSLQSELTELLKIPVTCWWRDDINRRLDVGWDLKLRYPEVLSGQDFLRLLVSTTQGQQHERRHTTLKAFLAGQYNEDREVKFKQVELQNKLLDLFVDLPFSIRIAEAPEPKALDQLSSALRLRWTPSSDRKSFVIADASQDEEESGTASLLLSEAGQGWLNQLIVEGAPGQGKSTLVQYICQVHRIRLLNKQTELAMLPKAHQNAAVYIPFKIDLRDLSEWLSGNDPFAAVPDTNKMPEDATLETFIARLVRHKAGGSEFSTDDFLSLARELPVFLALDGLDEVADIKRRSDVVSAVTKAIPRLKENCRSLRLIVTSRPAAFANSPGFDFRHFPYLQLRSVKRSQVNRYAGKWMDARQLSEKERQEFRSILDEKLAQPHLRDLSRNPMQLAILLSLIHTLGSALPDKRTKLYDDYVNLFFSRESTKNPVVREHLDLLKDIHRYIAWVLHSTSEAGKRGSSTAGRLSAEEFKGLLREYLENEKQNSSIVDEIFKVMLERVVMIVSRIEGTYEFEVQPLREYFAARFLYDTASYSPPGGEKAGTKPDRFDAIAANFYWLNVTRFFCGCFTKGELFDLADRVTEFLQDPLLGRTRHPAMLSAMLLSDWVFTQSPKAMEQVGASLATKDALRKLMLADEYPNEEAIRIPSSCGGQAILKKALELLFDTSTNYDYRSRFARYVAAHSNPGDIDRHWMAEVPSSNAGVDRWISIGAQLGSLARVSSVDFTEAVRPLTLSAFSIETVWRHGRGALLLSILSKDDDWTPLVFECPQFDPEGNGADAPFFLVPQLLGFLGGPFYFHRYPGFRASFLKAISNFEKVHPNNVEPPSNLGELGSKCFAISRDLAHLARSKEQANDSDANWEQALEQCVRAFGLRPAIIAAAVHMALAPRGKSANGPKARAKPTVATLCSRVRISKSRAKRWEWWRSQLGSCTNSEERFLAWLSFTIFSPLTVFMEHATEVSDLLEGLPNIEWKRLIQFIHIPRISRSTRNNKKPSNFQYSGSSVRFAYLLAMKDPVGYGEQMFMAHFVGYADAEALYTEFRQFHAINSALAGRMPWPSALEIVTDTYKKGAAYSIPSEKRLPDYIAEQVIAAPDNFPAMLWDRAQEITANKVRKHVRPVAAIAKKERWFAV